MLQYVDKLQCPLAQKLKLIDAVAETCRKRAEEERKANQHSEPAKEAHSREER